MRLSLNFIQENSVLYQISVEGNLEQRGSYVGLVIGQTLLCAQGRFNVKSGCNISLTGTDRVTVSFEVRLSCLGLNSFYHRYLGAQKKPWPFILYLDVRGGIYEYPEAMAGRLSSYPNAHMEDKRSVGSRSKGPKILLGGANPRL